MLRKGLLGENHLRLIEQRGKICLLPVYHTMEMLDLRDVEVAIASFGVRVAPLFVSSDDAVGPDNQPPQLVLHDIDGGVGEMLTREWPAYRLDVHYSYRRVLEELMDRVVGVFYAGGRAPEHMRNDLDLKALSREIFKRRLPVGMTCHGFEIPGYTKVDPEGPYESLLKGRRVTTVGKCVDELNWLFAIGSDAEHEVDRADGKSTIHSWATYHKSDQGNREFLNDLEAAAS